MKNSSVSLINELQGALDYAVQHERWVILVCPKQSKALESCKQILLGIIPDGVPHSGRTFLLGQGATISLAVSSDEVFAPPGDYDALFVAWEEVTENEVFLHMERWRKGAKRVLNSSWGYK